MRPPDDMSTHTLYSYGEGESFAEACLDHQCRDGFAEYLCMQIDIGGGCGRRNQGHVVKRRQQNSTIERRQMHVAIQIAIDRGRCFAAIERRRGAEPVFGAAAELSHMPG